MAAIRHFFTKVAGVTFANDDGSSRQEIITRCRLYERLILDHDENNPHDTNAVRVCRQNSEGGAGEQLGHLNRRLAEEVVTMSAKGYRFGIFVSGLTGGRGYKKSRVRIYSKSRRSLGPPIRRRRSTRIGRWHQARWTESRGA